MPSDIRSFFGGGGVKQEKPSIKSEEKSTSSNKRQKSRRVLSDSEDEVAPVKPTAKKTKAAARQPEPKIEEVEASSYFSSNTKAKAATPRATPKATPKSTPKKAKSESTEYALPRAERISPRKPTSRDAKATKTLKEEHDSGEDIFQDDIKTGRHMGDDYEESDSEEDFKPASKAPSKGKKRAPSDDDDEEDEEEVKPSKRRRGPGRPKANGKAAAPATNGRKRKSPDDSEEDSDASSVKPKKKVTKKAPAAKKASPKKKLPKEPPQESDAMKKILDSIPTIKAPSPPPKDGDAKAKFTPGQHANSGPPPAAGAVDIPVGAENCLAGLSFVFTGLGQYLDRTTGQNLVKQYGGKVMTSVSSKTDYVVLGSDAGPKKLETIKKFDIKTINEDGLFQMIRVMPANGGDSTAAAAYEEKKAKEQKAIEAMAAELDRAEKEKQKQATATSSIVKQPKTDSQLWTVKYAPNQLNHICGNKGQVEKLARWLKAFPSNLKRNFAHVGPDGSFNKRAIIIHGPAGIGKTTAAHVVANLEGYDVIESNASDTRSKKLVESGLNDVLDNTSLLGFYAGQKKKVEDQKKKIVLIMDEVDGMSAGDRGGVGALAAVCKKTSIPMILICNERRLQKMKPFDFVTYDLAFRRPSAAEVRSRVMTICHREGMRMPPPVVDSLIEGCHGDIRQIVNLLSTIKLDAVTPDFEGSKSMTKAWQKHVILRPWDIAQQILSPQMFNATSKTSLNDKAALYFNDHEMSFLMLQENYLRTVPLGTAQYSGRQKNLKHLELLRKASQSISDGDLTDRMIHGPQQHWSLMPLHAISSFVRPASFSAGTWARRDDSGGRQSFGSTFTSWLGQNSKQMKLTRFVKELQGHMRLRTSSNRDEIRQQYMPILWYNLVKKIQVEGKEAVPEMIDFMDSYFLTKEDWDAVLELGVGFMDQDKVKIETQTKSTFTRQYNAKSHPIPFTKASNVLAPTKASKVKPDLEDAIEESDEGEVIDEAKAAADEDGDVTKDKLIKQPKKKATAKGKGAKAGKGKAAEDSGSEDVKPKKAGRGKAAAKGKGKK